MPFPENPTDGQIYSKSGNLFIFKSGKGWSRIEPEVFFKQDTAPTISDIKGRKAIWQDTVNKIMYFWNSQINKWIYSPSACGTYVPLTPKYMTFYSQTAEELINSAIPLVSGYGVIGSFGSSTSFFNVLPLRRFSDPSKTMLQGQFTGNSGRMINSRIPTDYQIPIAHPLQTPISPVPTISYFIQFKDAFNKKISLKTAPIIKANWHSSNTSYSAFSQFKPNLTVKSVTKMTDLLNTYSYSDTTYLQSIDDSVYEVVVEVDSDFDSKSVNYSEDLIFNRPTTFNVELEATEYNLKLVNVIPCAYFEYQPYPYPSKWNTENITKQIKPYVNVVVYPQAHQVQTNGSVFNIPIITEIINGFTNIFDSAGNFTGFRTPATAPYKEYETITDFSETFSIEVTGIYDVNGTPVATLSGTKTKTVTNGLAIFDDLTLTVTGHTLISGKTPFAKLSITTSNPISFRSRDIFIYWT